MEKLIAKLKKLPRYPYHTWDRKDDGHHQELIGLDDVIAAIKSYDRNKIERNV
jgi:hypothetical protein